MTTGSVTDGKYPFIIKWHLRQGSLVTYINLLVQEAEKDKAPANSIFYSTYEKRWMTTDDISNPEIRKAWNLPVLTETLKAKVIGVTNKADKRGLYAVVIVSEKGDCFQIGCDYYGKPEREMAYNLHVDKHTREFKGLERIRYEAPIKLQDMPQAVIDELWG